MLIYGIYASMGLAFIGAFIFIYKLISRTMNNSIVKKKYKKTHKDELLEQREHSSLNEWLRLRKTGTFSYRRIDDMLNSTGARYRTRVKGDDYQTPADYIMECGLMSLVGMLFGAALPFILSMFVDDFAFDAKLMLAAIPCGLIFTKFPSYIAKSSNDKDNKKMLEDVSGMYETLKVCTASGIPLLDGLSECYRQVKLPRLKCALLELTSSIKSGKDMDESIENFRKQFASPEITQFCIVIRQGLETGRQEETLTDLTANMRALQDEINHQIEETLNTKGQLIQMGLLFVLMFMILYATVTTLNTQFNGMI